MLASTVPTCRTYDPAFIYELAVVIQDGIKRMYADGEEAFYYVTMYNEDYVQPPMPEGAAKGIVKGMYKLKAAAKAATVQLFGSGPILNEVVKAQTMLADKYGVHADVWSVTSYVEVRREALAIERWNRLHPAEPEKKSYVETLMEGTKGPIIAASDYMKSVPDGLSPWLGQRLVTLGTDRLWAQRQSRTSATALRGQRGGDRRGDAVTLGAGWKSRCKEGAEGHGGAWTRSRGEGSGAGLNRCCIREGGHRYAAVTFMICGHESRGHMAGKSYENPLLSHARLREMYTALLEVRGLGSRKASGRGFERGMEACWVGSAIGLRDGDGEGDFASAGTVGTALDLVLGLKLRNALGGDTASTRLRGSELKTSERLWFALGAASKLAGHKAVGVVYAGNGELTAAKWKLVLSEAQRMELPLVFVTIPAKGDNAGTAALADKCKLPGIPVDAVDAVAMYRVAQESIGRARAGGGPALIEAVRFPGSADPVKMLRRQLMAKRVATERWADALEQKVRSRLA